MRMLGKDGVLYTALAIVIAVLAPIIAFVCMVVGGAIGLVRRLIIRR